MGRLQPLISCQHSGAPGPLGDWQVCGGGVPSPRPHPSPLLPTPRLRGADPGPGRFVRRRELSPRCPQSFLCAPWPPQDPMTSACMTSPAGRSTGCGALWRRSSPPSPAQLGPAFTEPAQRFPLLSLGRWSLSQALAWPTWPAGSFSVCPFQSLPEASAFFEL